MTLFDNSSNLSLLSSKLRDNWFHRKGTNNTSNGEKSNSITVLIFSCITELSILLVDKLTLAGDFFCASLAICDGRNVGAGGDGIDRKSSFFVEFINALAALEFTVEIVLDVFSWAVYRRNVVALPRFFWLLSSRENSRKLPISWSISCERLRLLKTLPILKTPSNNA